MQVKDIIKQAKQEHDAGNLPGAAKIYLSVLKQHPENIVAINGAVETCEKIGFSNGLAFALNLKTRAKPKDVDTWVKLAGTLQDQGRISDAITCFRQALKHNPKNVLALLRLAAQYSRVCQYGHSLQIFEQFLSYYSLEALPPILMAEYVHVLVHSMNNDEDPADVIRKVLPVISKDIAALKKLVATAEQACAHELLIQLMDMLCSLMPLDELEISYWIPWARSACILGDEGRAAEIAQKALPVLDRMISRKQTPQHYGLADLHIIKARLNHLAGNDFVADLRAGTPPDTFPRQDRVRSQEIAIKKQFFDILPSWQEHFKNKDVCVLLNGPSLGDLERHIQELDNLDNLAFVVINAHEKTQQRILDPLGRRPDAIMMLSSTAFSWEEERILQQLDSDKPPFLISMATLVNSQTKAKELFKFQNRMFWINSRIAMPPSADNGLNFELINSLSALLPVLTTAEPRSIFLFGADGGCFSKNGNVYFGNKTRPDQEDNAAVNALYLHRLALEAQCADNILSFQLPLTAKIHGVRVPAIYTVCPTSNTQLFEKIDIETAIEKLRIDDHEYMHTKPKRPEFAMTLDM